MVSISSLSSLTSFSAQLADGPHSHPSRVSFRPLRVSASCATATATQRTAPRIASPGSLYEVLGIQMGATCGEIKAAYRKLARILHPDVAADQGQKEINAYEFIKIHEAYETLSDPEKRAAYDRSLYWRGRPMSSPFVTSSTATTVESYAGAGFSGFTGRRWETDQCW